MYTDGSCCHQRSVRVGLRCQARCDHHPQRQCSLHGFNLRLGNGGGSGHPCPPLDCPKRWRSDHTCHTLTDSTRFLQKEWKVELDTLVNVQHPCSKAPADVLPWTCQSEGKWLNRQASEKSNYHKQLVFQNLWSVEELETLPAGTQLKPPPHQPPGGERCRKRKRSTILHERTTVNQTSSGTVLKAMLQKLLRDGVKHIWALPSAQISS